MSAILADDRATDADSALSDAALARQTLEHPDAFAELYQRYRMRVYRYLRARLPNDEDAADVTQQVFVSAFGRLRQYRAARASFATWLLAIARHAATDFQRRHRSMAGWADVGHAVSGDDHDLAAGPGASRRLQRPPTVLPTSSPTWLSTMQAGLRSPCLP